MHTKNKWEHEKAERAQHTYETNQYLRGLRESGACCKLCCHMESASNYWHVCTLKANKAVKFYNLCEHFAVK